MQKEGGMVLSVWSIQCPVYGTSLAQRALYLMTESIQAVVSTYLIYAM
jgi:hypothetical protein